MGYFTVNWVSSGYTGSPGYTKLKFIQAEGTSPTVGEANSAAAASRALLTSIANFYPNVVVYQCQTSVQVFNNAGVLQNEVALGAVPANVSGVGGTLFPGGVGAVVYWLTGAINGGHKVKGRTYFVPLANGAFSNDGTLASTVVSSLTTAASTFIGTSPAPAVNTRSLGQADRGNATYAITGASVKDRTAFLRTRRT
jgi:hypothetical protein